MPGACLSGRSSPSGSRSASGTVRTVRSCTAFWNESRKLWWPPLPAIGGRSRHGGAWGPAALSGINAIRPGATAVRPARPPSARRDGRPPPRMAAGGAQRTAVPSGPARDGRRTATVAVAADGDGRGPADGGGRGGPPWTVGRRSRTAVGGTTQHLSHIVSDGDATRCGTRRSVKQVLRYTGRRARRRSTDFQIPAVRYPASLF